MDRGEQLVDCADPVPGSRIRELIDESEPATVRFDSPVLLITGALHARPQALLVQRICDFGTAAVLLHYPDATHTRLSSLSRSAALSCLEGESAERLAPACEPG